jgi:hypothetical protein
LEKIRDIPDSIAVRKEVPSAGTIAIIVEPGAENKVSSDAEEETTQSISHRGTERAQRG